MPVLVGTSNSSAESPETSWIRLRRSSLLSVLRKDWKSTPMGLGLHKQRDTLTQRPKTQHNFMISTVNLPTVYQTLTECSRSISQKRLRSNLICYSRLFDMPTTWTQRVAGSFLNQVKELSRPVLGFFFLHSTFTCLLLNIFSSFKLYLQYICEQWQLETRNSRTGACD